MRKLFASLTLALLLGAAADGQQYQFSFVRLAAVTTTTTSTSTTSTTTTTTSTTTTTTTLQPDLLCSKTTIDTSCFEGESPGNETYTLKNNNGSAAMAWTASENTAWFSVAPGSGSSTGELDVVTVTFATSELTPGTYQGTITNAATGATGSPDLITVTVEVQPQT